MAARRPRRVGRPLPVAEHAVMRAGATSHRGCGRVAHKDREAPPATPPNVVEGWRHQPTTGEPIEHDEGGAVA